LTWAAPHAPATITRVSAELGAATTAPKLEVRELVTSAAPAHELRDFDLGASLPIEAFELVLEQNSVIEAEVFARSDSGADFVRLHQGTFYQLQHAGEELHGPRIDIPRQRFRTLRVRIAAKGGGLGASQLRLKVYTVPEQLVFVARGAGPFTLAFGRAGAPPGAFDADELVGLVGETLLTLPPNTTNVGALIPLGGEAVLLEPKVVNTKQIALWTVLLVAVGLLAALSIRLLKRVEKGTDTHVD
jgi:hypothetical protein